jgi:SAM-dependent methyltransferase
LVAKRVDRVRGVAVADTLDREIGLARRRMLDVGSGVGETVLECLKRGADVTGVEPDQELVEIARALLLEHAEDPTRVMLGVGERLPFRDGTFEIVVCNHVLEHVRHIRRVVAEMVRVTEPGGWLLVSGPNYLFPYEGHYEIKWVPLIPKRLGAWLLTAKGRNPDFLLHHVRYTTYPAMLWLWWRHQLTTRNLTAEAVRGRRHPSVLYDRPLFRHLALRLGLYPSVTWLLRKPV